MNYPSLICETTQNTVEVFYSYDSDNGDYMTSPSYSLDVHSVVDVDSKEELEFLTKRDFDIIEQAIIEREQR
jgi:hypothetical protein